MQIGRLSGFNLGYHDPVYDEDGTDEGPTTDSTIPIPTGGPLLNGGLLLMLGCLLLLIAMSEED